jgi:hypothetical protein
MMSEKGPVGHTTTSAFEEMFAALADFAIFHDDHAFLLRSAASNDEARQPLRPWRTEQGCLCRRSELPVLRHPAHKLEGQYGQHDQEDRSESDVHDGSFPRS